MATFPTASKIERLVKPSTDGQVYIFFGGDAKKNPFEAAGKYLKKRLENAYKSSKVKVNEPKLMTSAGEFMEFLLKDRASEAHKIRELHVFSHSWPTGLSLNYLVKPTEADTEALVRVYGKEVKLAIGADNKKQFHPCQFRIANLQHLTREQIKKLQKSFGPGALARLWGCNSGVGGGDPYGCIAGAFAQYARITCHGAPGPTQFYAFIKTGEKKVWTTKHAPVGKEAKWPFELRAYKSTKKRQGVVFTPTVADKDLTIRTIEIPKPTVKITDDFMEPLPIGADGVTAYALKPKKAYMFYFENFPHSKIVAVVKDSAGKPVSINDILKVTSHPEWTVQPDGLSIHLIPGRTVFTGKTLDLAALMAKKRMETEMYFSVSYKDVEGAAKTEDFKKPPFKIVPEKVAPAPAP